ncbi:type II toxin-antitoxin system Phd/YefM family antitoxin [Amaricoccus sp. W119]|uniref:type II toxin-antitoxin system Phd/YefM family antitoxin n=1 Tax=Amaricoccus sp. W119 TaxID=3391833 RepID=UPI0039A43513
MRAVGAFDEATHHSELLAAVEQGETVIITRRGRPVARLVPEPAAPDRAAAIARLRALRARVGGALGLEDILSARVEGRR